MLQTDFETRREPHWNRFDAWLRARQVKRDKRLPPLPDALKDAEIPAAFRQLCADLALARSRQYSPDLVDRLNALVLAGHHAIYGVGARHLGSLFDFVRRDFPRLVRSEWRVVALATLLFFGPFFALIIAIQVHPDFAGVILSPNQMGQMQEMYRPSNHPIGMRESDTNVAMFGFYIWNNVRIGFQTFAGGLVFGLGSIYFLLYNGVFIGAVSGYLTEVGLGDTFWSFVAGHSPYELTAIVLSGAAGLKLGLALVAPGRRSRRQALVENGRIAARLMLGSAIGFVIAAGLEAFWSPLVLVDPLPKYLVGALGWFLVLTYLGFVGRSRAV